MILPERLQRAIDLVADLDARGELEVAAARSGLTAEEVRTQVARLQDQASMRLDDAPPHGWRLTGERVDALDGSVEGAWLVATQGSMHLWEIRSAAIYWTRLPGMGRGDFKGDREPQRLTRIDRWPAVGASFLVWFDDPDRPLDVDQWRRSSWVRWIERVERTE